MQTNASFWDSLVFDGIDDVDIEAVTALFGTVEVMARGRVAGAECPRSTRRAPVWLGWGRPAAWWAPASVDRAMAAVTVVVPAARQQLSKDALAAMTKGVPAATARGYLGDWASFEQWALAAGLRPPPARP
ncbi:hypothetical protein [Streptomyces sp. NPDC054849]